MTDKQKAIIRYHESGIEKEEQSPLERLRFFCSLAMSGDDWVDAGHFFDSLALQVRDKVDVGPWSAGATTDGRAYLESSDFTHDVRLYVDGDFAWPGDKLNYAQGIARQLNADSNVAVTWDESMSRILAVTRQDSDGKIISVIAEVPSESTVSAEPVGYVSKQAIERFQDGRHADIYPSIEELTHEFFDATPMALYADSFAVQAQQEKIQALESEVSGLRAARIAYANEFPLDEEGNPDVGNIHANIRKLKGQEQQPISGADGLPEEPEYSQAWRKHAALYGHDSQHAFTAGWNAAKDDMLTHCVESAIHIAEEKVKAQQPVSSADQFRDAAQMIEPSGNSGELDELAAFEKWVSQFDTFSDEYRDMGSNEYFFAGYRAALDQQDDRSDWCRLSGCSHKAAGSPVWNNKQDAETGKSVSVGNQVVTQQDADKVDAALAEMVHAMFRSGNDVPVTRITIDRKQYEAAVNSARKEQE